MGRPRTRGTGRYAEIGQRLRQLREKLGISQQEFAAQLGITQGGYGKVELGDRRPSAEMLIALRRLHGISPEEIIDGASTAPPTEFGEQLASLTPHQRALVRAFVAELVEGGDLPIDPARLRTSLRLLRPLPGEEHRREQLQQHRVVRIFRIAAGRGIEAARGADEIEVPLSMAKDVRNCYALHVEGDSMIEEGIHRDDIILVRIHPEPPDGSIAVVRRTTDNLATLKRIYRRGVDLELRPANTTMKPFRWPMAEVAFDGIFLGVLRHAVGENANSNAP